MLVCATGESDVMSDKTWKVQQTSPDYARTKQEREVC